MHQEPAAPKKPSGLGLIIGPSTSMCDVCNKRRSVGNHAKCSVRRAAMYRELRAKDLHAPA